MIVKNSISPGSRAGDWDARIVRNICGDLNLRHAVDPFARKTETPEKCYYRLHGQSGFRYKYEEEELIELLDLISEKKKSYVFFNNKFMVEDALVFADIMKSKESGLATSSR